MTEAFDDLASALFDRRSNMSGNTGLLTLL